MKHPVARQHGATLIEVLVSIIIVVFGLLGLAGLQSRVSLAEVEAFQRAQAILLLQDMVSRINANRRNATSYVTASPLGTGNAAADCSTSANTAALDLCEWNNALLGATEGLGGNNVGAMQDARGCIANTVAAMPKEFQISVVWRGSAPTVAPGATTCGQGSYSNDATRRALTATVKLGCLQNNTANGTCISTYN
ncbi:MAG TPA: prepilin-type N-terminal cleavage/methylation domain-containing protein [Usitatibacter sp.]|jgi:type IV pilus assembly protein PilV|nr:prepilin-type N-terminal cleavage/methylation domain-containing protein [Usitatibacter sp.]